MNRQGTNRKKLPPTNLRKDVLMRLKKVLTSKAYNLLIKNPHLIKVTEVGTIEALSCTIRNKMLRRFRKCPPLHKLMYQKGA